MVDVLVRIDDDSLLEKLHLPKGSMQLIQEDTLAEIRKSTAGMKIHRATGGSASNTVSALAALGATPGFIGKIGKDETGQFFDDTLRQRGVKTALKTCDLPSGIASTFISPDGERTFGTYLGQLPPCMPRICRAICLPVMIISISKAICCKTTA